MRGDDPLLCKPTFRLVRVVRAPVVERTVSRRSRAGGRLRVCGDGLGELAHLVLALALDERGGHARLLGDLSDGLVVRGLGFDGLELAVELLGLGAGLLELALVGLRRLVVSLGLFGVGLGAGLPFAGLRLPVRRVVELAAVVDDAGAAFLCHVGSSPAPCGAIRGPVRGHGLMPFRA